VGCQREATILNKNLSPLYKGEEGVGVKMKYSKIFRTMVLTIILSLLLIAIPATPALAATITLSPTSGAPGSTVTVTGTGFSPTHEIEILFDGNRQHFWQTTSTTFIKIFTVPTTKAAGSYLVEVNDWTTLTQVASASFIVTGAAVGEAEIDLDPDKGAVGLEVEIEGDDFGDREDIIVEYDGDDIDIEGDKDTDRDGDFTCYIIIPESTAGDHTITVTGEDTHVEAEAEFTIEPEITISPTSGTPNTNVTITGTGFGRIAVVTIYFAGAEIMTDEADTDGSFETIFPVMAIASGTYEIEVEDEDDNTATTKFTIEIEAGAEINPTEGNVGTEVTVSGIGFKASGKITVKYDDKDIATTTADGNGGFSATFSAPASTGGPHTVTVTDGDITKECTFTMESEPPLIPAPLLPAMDTKLEAEEEAYFDWADVTDDPSGVTYIFQIATDKNFTDDSVVLEKRNLKDSEYTLTKVERESLVPTEETEEEEITYYWRIKAIDGASNESDWAGTGSFIIPLTGLAVTLPTGFGLPQWAIYALFGFGALVIGLIGFFLGRKSAYM